MKKALIVGLVALAGLSTANAVEVYLQPEHTTWKEYMGGNQLLKESGMVYRLGVKGTVFNIKGIQLVADGNFRVGSIDYDGHTWGGTPVKTDTRYVGMELRPMLQKEFVINNQFSVVGGLGLGYDLWNRNLKETSNATGYTEVWEQFYLPVQAQAKYRVNQDLSLTAGLEYRFNLRTTNRVDAFDATVKPKSGTHYTLQAGMEYKKFTLTGFYRYDKWKQSDPEYSPVLGVDVLQPESKRELLGIALGYKF